MVEKWTPPLSVPDAWRCGSCKELMYNVSPETGQPAKGAPLPHYINQELPKVCSLCHFLWRGLPDSIEKERLVRN